MAKRSLGERVRAAGKRIVDFLDNYYFETRSQKEIAYALNGQIPPKSVLDKDKPLIGKVIADVWSSSSEDSDWLSKDDFWRDKPELKHSEQYKDKFFTIVLAGGKGSRFVEGNIPKWLLPMFGKTVVEWPLEAVYEAGLRKVVLVTPPSGDYDIDMVYLARQIRERHPEFNKTERGFSTRNSKTQKVDSFLDVRSFLYDETPPVPYVIGRIINKIDGYRLMHKTDYVVFLFGDTIYPKEAIQYTLDKSIEKLVTEDDAAVVHLVKGEPKSSDRRAFVVDKQGLMVKLAEKEYMDCEPDLFVFRWTALEEVLNRMNIPETFSQCPEDFDGWIKKNSHKDLKYMLLELTKMHKKVHVTGSHTTCYNVNNLESYKAARQCLQEKNFKQMFEYTGEAEGI